MASYIRPDDRWWIDWNDSKTEQAYQAAGHTPYDHPFSDVTADYDSYTVRYGADTESNPASIALTQAHGKLRLNDIHNRYDPGSVNSDIESSLLRKPHKVKLVADGDILWEGVAVPTTGRKLTASDFADFELESANYALYRRPLAESQSGGTLSAYLTAAIPPEMFDADNLVLNDDFTVGRAVYDGTTIGFINQAATYACAWPWENKSGKVGLTAYEKALSSASVTHITRRWNPRREGHLFEHRPRYVRNTATPQSIGEVTGFREILQEYRVNNYSLGTEGKEIIWSDPDPTGIRMEWAAAPLTADKISGGTQAEVVQVNRQADPDGRSVKFQLKTANKKFIGDNPAFPNSSWGGDAEYNLRLIGRRVTLQTVKTKSLVETESLRNFGPQVLQFPTWFPNRDKEFNAADVFIKRLGTPLRYVRLVMSRWHKDRTIVDALEALDSGQIIDVTLLDVDNIPTKVKLIVLACQYEKALNQTPTKTVYGITIEEGDVTSVRWRDALSDTDAFTWQKPAPIPTDADKPGYWRQ